MILYHLDVVHAIVDSCSSEMFKTLAVDLVTVFKANRVEQSLIHWALVREVKRTAEQATLFRNNSIATCLLSLYFKQRGLVYIRWMTDPLFDRIEKACANGPLEVRVMGTEQATREFYLLNGIFFR